MLQNLSQIFNDNPWLNILFLFLAIFSIILSLIFYFKSKKEKRPTYSKKTSNVIQRTVIKSNKLEVKYNGSSIENLSMTEFAFWNSGRETIRGIDIAPSDPLIIKSTAPIILYDFEVQFKNDINNFIIQKINENSLKLSFDFIDFNQGVKLKIYHSGNLSSELLLQGTIIGSEGIKPGVKKEFTMNKIDFLGYPSRKLLKSKVILFKIIGFLYALIVFPIFLLLALILTPTDYIYGRFHNAHPKEFLLYD